MCRVTVKASGETPHLCKLRKTWDRQRSAEMRGGIKGVSLHCYLKTSTRVVLLPPHLSLILFTSSPFPFNPPFHPPALVSGPSVTLTCTTAVFRPPAFPVYFCLFHRCACACLRALWTVYKYTISGHVHTGDRGQDRVHFSVCFVETGHPQGNTSISWPDSGNRPKQDVTQSL